MTHEPLVSIVTISFNQAKFLERAILSVLEQDYPNIEYIIVDPGSTDGSREIINKYRDRISKIIFEPDNGPADGLNKGFAQASGTIFGFLNSDDILLPSALSEAVSFLVDNAEVDVVSAHAYIIDPIDRKLRKVFSSQFDLTAYAYGGMELIQPATFFRSTAFSQAGGFNSENRSNWDGELWVDMALAGANFIVVKAFWGGYRLHRLSITASKSMDGSIKCHSKRMFVKIMNREPILIDRIQRLHYRIRRHLLHPVALYERVMHGKIYGCHV